MFFPCLCVYCVFCVFRYGLGVSQEEMKQELHDYLPSLEHWAKEYLNSPNPKAINLKMYARTNARCYRFVNKTPSLSRHCTNRCLSIKPKASVSKVLPT